MTTTPKKRGRPTTQPPTAPVVNETIPEGFSKINPRTGRRTTNYLNNPDMMKAVAESKALGRMSDTLAKMLMLLVKRYASKANYANYSYNDEMQAFALVSLSKTWAGFNEEKSSNPFSYYTQCTKNAFIQYLKVESAQRRIKNEYMIENGLDPSYSYQLEYAEQYHHDRHEDYDDARIITHDYISDRVVRSAAPSISNHFDDQAEHSSVLEDEDYLPPEEEDFTPTSMLEDFNSIEADHPDED